jgi:hypothetical protein
VTLKSGCDTCGRGTALFRRRSGALGGEHRLVCDGLLRKSGLNSMVGLAKPNNGSEVPGLEGEAVVPIRIEGDTNLQSETTTQRGLERSASTRWFTA